MRRPSASESDPTKWLDLDWVDRRTGDPTTITTEAPDGEVRPGVQRVRTYRDALGAYLAHPESKSLAPDGRHTRGLLRRRPVTDAGPPIYIGKEGNRIEDRITGIVDTPDQYETRYPTPTDRIGTNSSSPSSERSAAGRSPTGRDSTSEASRGRSEATRCPSRMLGWSLRWSPSSTPPARSEVQQTGLRLAPPKYSPLTCGTRIPRRSGPTPPTNKRKNNDVPHRRLDTAPEAWKPQPGDKLVGRIVEIDDRTTEYGTYPIITIQTEEGAEKAFHAYHTVARNELQQLSPIIGDNIGIAYHGKHPTKDYEKYRIIVEREEVTSALTEELG